MQTRSNSIFDIGASNFNELLDKRIEMARQTDIKIALPAIVTNVDNYATKQCINVTPLINDAYEEEDLVLNAPTIKSVFVRLPGGNGFEIKIPIKVGDLVVLHWTHKNLSKFLEGDGSAVDVDVSVSPEERDCWAEPGFGVRKDNYGPSQTDFQLTGPATSIDITQEGAVTISTDSDVDITIKGAKTEKVTGNVTLTVGGNLSATVSGNATIESSKHTIDAPITQVTGNLIVAGNISCTGEYSGGTGTCTIPYLVVENTGIIPTLTTADSLKAGGVEVIGHVHGGVESGGSTTEAMEAG